MDEADTRDVRKKDSEPLTYSSYLRIPQLLECQHRKSEQNGRKPAHEELLFIIMHQVQELWFKQTLFDIESINDLLKVPIKDENCSTSTIIQRLNRVILVLKLVVEQFSVIETMTPNEFLEFRDLLGSSSGFQSLQFRLLENKIGLKENMRVDYNKETYRETLKDDPGSMERIDKSVGDPSLFDLIQRWLERTPGLDSIVENWVKSWNEKMESIHGPETEFQKYKKSFEYVINEKAYAEYLGEYGEGRAPEHRFTFRAFQAAMMISLYRDRPRFQHAHEILRLLMDVDNLIMKWRYNHILMIHRMIGNKVGTGGSSGYDYLRSTISDTYRVFIDLFNLSTFLVPKRYIPPLSGEMEQLLSKQNRN